MKPACCGVNAVSAPRLSPVPLSAFSQPASAMKHLLRLLCLAALSSAAAHAAEQLVDTTIRPGTNAVQTLWNATPGRTYRLQATTNLTAPWLNGLTSLSDKAAEALAQHKEIGRAHV